VIVWLTWAKGLTESGGRYLTENHPAPGAVAAHLTTEPGSSSASLNATETSTVDRNRSGSSHTDLRLPPWKPAVTCNEAPHRAFKINPLTVLPPILDVVSYCGDALIIRAHGHHETAIRASDSLAGHFIALARTHTSKPGAK
jgi:hypothetical protein